jgi:UDP-N-acetylglucosamine--dolichyl-phosphate N-acetylglucosaminephosphotransferase
MAATSTAFALSISAAFFVTLIALPLWIRRRHDHGLVGKDMHKPGKPLVAEQGGVIVTLGVVAGILTFVALEVFVRQRSDNLVLIFAMLTSFLLASFIGFVDGVLGWRLGLRQLHKLLISFIIPLPLMAVSAGTHHMTFPFFGRVELGLLYPLIVIPIGVVGAANGFNMLAGYNGLEAGLGAVILGTLSLIAWQQGAVVPALLGLIVAAALLAFLFYNRHPASVFPGDSLTYATGTAIAGIAILANIEFFALIMFIPYFVEFILKARTKFTPGRDFRWASIARLLPDGTLAVPGKWCTLPHVAIAAIRGARGRATETQTVLAIIGIELLFAIGAIITLLARQKLL